MPLKNKSKGIVPWDYQIEDEKYQKEPWILKKGKEYVTIEKHKNNKSFFLLKKDEEKCLSLNASQAKLTYQQLIKFGYKLRKPKIEITLTDVDITFDFYGAGVATTRPGGGPPSLELLSQTSGKLTCICGTGDPLIPEADRISIQQALKEADSSEVRLSYVEIEDADHGFMCEQRGSFNPNASILGWQLLMNGFKE